MNYSFRNLYELIPKPVQDLLKFTNPLWSGKYPGLVPEGYGV